MDLISLRGIRQQRIASHFKLRRGVSLIEVLFVIVIVGLLLAITLPGVQRSRNAARMIQCKNNMRQIGLALHSFHEERGRLPGNSFVLDLLPFIQPTPWVESYRSRIVGFGSINRPPGEYVGKEVPVFSCPDDEIQNITKSMVVNYFPNIGSQFFGTDYELTSISNPVTFSDITDGLSQTAAFSERLVHLLNSDQGLGNSPVYTPTAEQKKRMYAVTEGIYESRQLDVFANACQRNPQWIRHSMLIVPCGVLSSGSPHCGYNHVLTPNENSCINGLPLIDNTHDVLRFGAQTASSGHSDGVNTLFADGAVRFISDSIDSGVWRALGTCKGGEAASLESF